MIAFAAWTWMAACGSPAGLEVFHFTFDSLPSKSAQERSLLVENVLPRTTHLCGEAQIAFDLVQLTDPQTGAAYFDNLRVTVVDAAGSEITARAGNVENRGDESRVEMALPMVVSVAHSTLLASSLFECGYRVRARAPYVEPL